MLLQAYARFEVKNSSLMSAIAARIQLSGFIDDINIQHASNLANAFAKVGCHEG